MKRLKILSCLIVLTVILVIPAIRLMPETPVSQGVQTDDRKKDNKIESIINQVREYRKAGKFEEALKQLDTALEKFPQKENREKLQIERADVHYWWAESLRKKYDYTKAIKHYELAYAIDKNYRPKDAALDLNNIGFVYDALGQKQKALAFYQQALPIVQAVGDRAGEATTLNNIGAVYDDLGQRQKALAFFQQALPIYKEVGDRTGEATTLNNIGAVYDALGQKQKALAFFQQALPIVQAVGDRAGEAATLNNIGKVYSDLGQKQKALAFYQQALPIVQAVGDRAGEATTLNNIGLVYDALGQKQKALAFYQQALPIVQAVGDLAGEAATLNNIGKVYSDLGQKQKALAFYQQALPIYKEVGDRAGEATTLNNIGAVYNALGQKQKALAFYQQALPIRKEVGDRAGEATTLNNIGFVYDALGQKQKALAFFQQALPIFQAVGDRAGEVTTLNNIGAVYDALGQKQKALAFYQQALPILKEVGERAGEAATLNNIGAVYDALGQKQKALAFYQQALPIVQAVGNRAGEATTLNNIGFVYDALGQKQKALAFYQQALPIYKEVGNRAGEATTLHNLMLCWESLENTPFSIFYGKQAVNALQNLRTNISALDKEIRQSYFETEKNTYRFLANLLMDAGRIPETQLVLDMLKEEEFFQFIRRDRSYTLPTYRQLDFNEFERKWLQKYDTIMKNLSKITGEYYILNKKKIKKEAEKNRLEELEIILEKSRDSYHQYLRELKADFAQHNKDIKNGKYKAFIMTENARSLQSTLKTLDQQEEGKSAALNFLVHDGKVRMIITTPDSQLPVSAIIEEKKLNRLILRYRETAGNLEKTPGGNNAIPPDLKMIYKQLYEAVFKPVDKELKTYGANNLMIFLDGVLRYIPFPALWDGETFLVQRYRMTLFTLSSLTRIQLQPAEYKKILGFGASGGVSGFSSLDYVEEEIRCIVNDKEKGFNGFIDGKAFLDKDFTKAAFLTQLKTGDFPLVHISSHFEFSPGDETKNYLLMGDGSAMTLAELRNKGTIFHNVELLMLAACETATGGGNGMEIDGFGELAQQNGAKTVVASLWKVMDESTKELMVTFYRILNEGKVTSKIETLRLAQLELAGLDDLLDKNNSMKKKKKSKYSHPYYWGPFIMIGNWR